MKIIIDVEELENSGVTPLSLLNSSCGVKLWIYNRKAIATSASK